MGLRLDTTPLRTSRDYRLLWTSGWVMQLGQMVTYVAVPAQVHRLTGSNTAVGALGAVEVVPLVVFGLWGGALADHLDRRRLLVRTGIAQAAVALALLLNAASGRPQVWLLYVLGMVAATIGALARPSREALVPRTVERGQLAAAVSLDALASRLGDHPHGEGAERASLAGIGAGLRYAVGRHDLLGTYAVDLVAMTLAFPVAVFPAFADELGHPGSLGLLYAAGSVGAVVVTATSGWTGRVRHRGRAVAISAACWGAAMAAAGAFGGLALVLIALGVAGAADMVSGLFRTVIWHETIPDGLRGRLAGVEMLSYTLGPLAGQVRAGAAADLVGVRPALVSGGVACVVGVALVVVLLPALWRYDRRAVSPVGGAT